MLTLSMIVKNEEKYLPGCLDSVKEVVDEIIIVDTGSTDNTKKIAESYGAKVFDFEWINDFSAARNYALSKSTGNWILYLDADERLSEDSQKEIIRITNQERLFGYYCSVISIDDIKNRQSTMSYVRLFANSEEISFEGAVHEQIEFSLKRNNYKIKSSTIQIKHLGYNINQDGLEIKAKRNLDLLMNEYNKSPNSYLAFQIGQTYGVLQNGEYAEKYFLLALKDVSLKNEFKSLAYRYIAIRAAEKNNFDEAKRLITKSLECDYNQPLALLAAAKISIKLSDACAAEKYVADADKINTRFLNGTNKSYQTIYLGRNDFIYQALEIAMLLNNSKMYFELLDRLHKSKGENDKKHKSEYELFDYLMNNKGFSEEKAGEFAKVIDHNNYSMVAILLKNCKQVDSSAMLYEKLLSNQKNDSNVMNDYASLLMELKSFEKAIKLLENSYNINPNNPSTIFFLISAYINSNNFDKVKPLLLSAKSAFNSHPNVLQKIKLVEQKLSGIL